MRHSYCHLAACQQWTGRSLFKKQLPTVKKLFFFLTHPTVTVFLPGPGHALRVLSPLRGCPPLRCAWPAASVPEAGPRQETEVSLGGSYRKHLSEKLQPLSESSPREEDFRVQRDHGPLRSSGWDPPLPRTLGPAGCTGARVRGQLLLRWRPGCAAR